MTDGFDKTSDGVAMIALLRKHAPAAVDARAAASHVSAKLREPASGWLGWLLPVGVAAAAAVIMAVVFFPSPIDAPKSPETAQNPVERKITPTTQSEEAVIVGVREVSGAEITLDAGLVRGLRVGDVLIGGETRALVTAVGIFHARAGVESGAVPARGAKLSMAPTEAVRRVRTFEFIGGDPGALYSFGAILEALPPQEARKLGLSDGKALVVVDVMGSVLRQKTVEATLAGKIGLQKGDVILSCNGLPASDLAQFIDALELSKRGTLKARVMRNGREVELK